jgi:hypothetical protein
MGAFLSLVLDIVVLPFKTKARLEAEIIMLRHQLNVLRRSVPSKPMLGPTDRFLFVWLYRLFPTALNAIAIVRPETIIRRIALEIALAWWSAKDTVRGPAPDPGDERGQSAVGRTTHSWRIAETRDRGRTVDSRQV